MNNNERIILAVIISAVLLIILSATAVTVFGEKNKDIINKETSDDSKKKVVKSQDNPTTTMKDKKTVTHTSDKNPKPPVVTNTGNPIKDNRDKLSKTFKHGVDGSVLKQSKQNDNNISPQPTITPITGVIPIQQKQQDNTNTGSNTATTQDVSPGNINKDKTTDKIKDTPKADTPTTPKNNTSNNSDGKGSTDKETGKGTVVTGNNKNDSTTPTPIPPPTQNCGAGMKLDKDGKTCILDKNCEFKDKNQTVIACVNTVTKKIIIHENHNSHGSSSGNTVINNNNFVNFPSNGALLHNNIFTGTNTPITLSSSSSSITTPVTLLLLDAKQILDLAGDTKDSSTQTLFCTTSFKSTFSEQDRTWFITGTVQNINTITPNPIPNIHLTAAFYDINGNSIATIPNIAITPDSLAHDQEGRFTFTASLDNDFSGLMPLFIVLDYNI